MAAYGTGNGTRPPNRGNRVLCRWLEARGTHNPAPSLPFPSRRASHSCRQRIPPPREEAARAGRGWRAGGRGGAAPGGAAAAGKPPPAERRGGRRSPRRRAAERPAPWPGRRRWTRARHRSLQIAAGASLPRVFLPRYHLAYLCRPPGRWQRGRRALPRPGRPGLSHCRQSTPARAAAARSARDGGGRRCSTSPAVCSAGLPGRDAGDGLGFYLSDLCVCVRERENTYIFMCVASTGAAGDGETSLCSQGAFRPCFADAQALRAGTRVPPPRSPKWCFHKHQPSENLRAPENTLGRSKLRCKRCRRQRGARCRRDSPAPAGVSPVAERRRLPRLAPSRLPQAPRRRCSCKLHTSGSACRLTGPRLKEGARSHSYSWWNPGKPRAPAVPSLPFDIPAVIFSRQQAAWSPPAFLCWRRKRAQILWQVIISNSQ